MTIYVSELPKSCKECFCNVEDTWCALSDGEMGDICEECDNKTRHKNCPLLSLADYTKQVRKEVVQEIKDKLKLKEKFHPEDDFEIDYDFYYKEDVEEVLDQIE